MNKQNGSALTEATLRGRFYLEHYAFIALIIFAIIGEAVTSLSPYLGIGF